MRGVTGWTCILMASVLAVSVSAQAPTNSLETAIKELQLEIQRTRAEVKALREQQEKQAAEERRARQRQEAQRARAQRRTEAAQEAATPRRIAKKNAVIEIRITENEAALRQAELVLAELENGPVPKTPERAEHQKVMAALVIERNALREKIRRQNNKRLCRWFHLGCVKVATTKGKQ